MRAPTPSMETRSEPTLECHTDAIILRDGAGAVCSTYLRGSSSGPSAPPSATSLSLSLGTPTTASEPPPFAVRRSAFPAAEVAIVVGVGPATQRVKARARALERTYRRAGAVAPSSLTRGASAVAYASAFALGAATAASVGHVADRALEIASFACMVAGAVTLLVGILRTRARVASCGKRRAVGRRD